MLEGGGVGKEGSGLGDMGTSSPWELAGRAGHSACLQRAGEQAGGGQQRPLPGSPQRPPVGAAGCPGGGVFWFLLYHWKVREGRGCADPAEGAEPIGSRFAGAEKG